MDNPIEREQTLRDLNLAFASRVTDERIAIYLRETENLPLQTLQSVCSTLIANWQGRGAPPVAAILDRVRLRHQQHEKNIETPAREIEKLDLSKLSESWLVAWREAIEQQRWRAVAFYQHQIETRVRRPGWDFSGYQPVDIPEGALRPAVGEWGRLGDALRS